MTHVSKSRFPVSPAAERTVDGKVFASKREANRYSQLKTLEMAAVISNLECQPSFEVLINGELFCRYTADFRYFSNRNGKVKIEDVKSIGTARDTAYRLRKKSAELYHGITVIEVIA